MSWALKRNNKEKKENIMLGTIINIAIRKIHLQYIITNLLKKPINLKVTVKMEKYTYNGLQEFTKTFTVKAKQWNNYYYNKKTKTLYYNIQTSINLPKYCTFKSIIA